MLLALAVLLLQPQVHPQPSIDISKLDASAAVSSAAVSGRSDAVARSSAEPAASAAYTPVFPAATASATPAAAPAETPAASPEPLPAAPIVLSPAPDSATESSSLALSTPPISAGQTNPFKAAMFSVIDPKFETRRDQRMWTALSIAQHTGAGFDSWTTRREISSGQGVEMNPFLKPFADNNSLYVVMQITPVALDYVARRMMYSSHTWERKIWWMPQVLGTASSFAAGAHNLGVRATAVQ
ncbi:MAG: hypothetical protein WBF35_05110 [Candidatus Acidiferrales bacterium]